MGVHDISYKLLFSHQRTVEDLLRGFVSEEWVDFLDFSTLEKLNSSYVTEELLDRASDIVWRVRFNGDWIYIYLLIEFQSTVDPWMALRVMVYTGLMYQDLIRTGQINAGKEKLPPVFPIVIYNGQTKWTAACEMSSLIEPVPVALSRYQPEQHYFLLAENAVDVAKLQDTQNVVTNIIRLETLEDPLYLRNTLSNLAVQLKAKEFDELRKAFTGWIREVIAKRVLPDVKISELIELEEINNMLAERVEHRLAELESQVRHEVTQKIRQEGIQVGRQEGEGRLLKKQLQRRFGLLPDGIDDRIEQATTEQIETWAMLMLEATSLKEVFK